MFKLLCVVCLCLIIDVVPVLTQTCEYMNEKILVKYHETDDGDPKDWIETRTEGCISDKSFKNLTISQMGLYCDSTSLPILEENIINNMETLTYFYVGPCRIQVIQPGAFLNLPKLIFININGNPFTVIPNGVFNTLPSLQKLHIFSNQVSEIEDHALGNLPDLKNIHLSANKLDHIKRDWFTNTTNIEEFVIYKNSIEKIPSGMFHGWKKLKNLDLTSNRISVIEGELIKDNSPFMIFVGLHRNRLRTFPADTISNKTFVDTLAISGNLLNYLPEDFLKTVRLIEIAIFNNPFSCPCFDKINQIFLKRDIVVNNPTKLTFEACKNSDVPTCGSVSSKTCVESVDKNLTMKIITYMKKLRYDTVLDYLGQQCATFDDSD